MSSHLFAVWGGRLGLDRQERYVALTNLALVILLALSLARFSWQLVEPATLPATALVPSTAVAATAKPAARELQQVAKLHLFGLPGEEESGRAEAVIDAPKTRLNLTLRGVIPAIDGDQPFALIADSRGEEHPYRAGDEIGAGAVLERVHSDRVLLRRGGKLETLFLSEAEPLDSTSAVSMPHTARRQVPNAALAARLDRFRDRLLSNPSNAWKSVSVQPVKEGATIKGYRIEPKRGGRLLTQAGLRNGDIVTSVNGIPLSDTTQVGQVIRQLSTASRLNLQIERNGAPQALVVDIGR